MAGIKNIEGLTTEEINRELAHGAKFVMYQYTISLILITFKRSSDIYFVRPDENSALKALPFSVVTMVLGWWGIPWGPIYTISSLYRNMTGGQDVTVDVASLLNSEVKRAA